MESFKGYMKRVIKNIAESVMKDSIKNPKEIAFILKFRGQYKKANIRRENFKVRGTHIPPFIIGSIGTGSMYGIKSFTKGTISNELSIQDWKRVFNEAKELGVCSMLLSIGNTNKYKEILREASRVKNIIFPILMGDSLLNTETIEIFNNNRNLIPILNMYSISSTKSLNLMSELDRKKIIYSIAVNVNKDNFKDVFNEEFLNDIYTKQCKAVVFFEQSLNASERKKLDQKKDILRNKFNNMILLSFPTDEKYLGCLSAGRGFVHINPEGWVEPCPFSPCSDRNLKEVTLLQAMESPLFKRIKEGKNTCKII